MIVGKRNRNLALDPRPRRGARVALRMMLPVALVGVVVALIGADIVARRIERRWESSLNPPRQPLARPDGLGAIEHVRLTTRDSVELRGWYVPSANRAAVILGHGQGAQRAQLLPEARALVQRGFGVLMIDWRGHGESGGTRSTWGGTETRDLESAVNWLTTRSDVDPTRIGAFGFSMGATIVAVVAEHDTRLRAVALEGVYASLEEMVRAEERRWLRWWTGSVAVRALRRAGVQVDSVRPIDALCRIAPRPLLLIVGGSDADIPPGSGDQMFGAACEPKSLWVIPGATHTSYASVGGDAYGQRLGEFFDQALLHDQPVATHDDALTTHESAGQTARPRQIPAR